MAPRKRLLYKLIIPICATCIGLLISEIGAGVYGYILFSTVSVSRLYERDRNNTFIKDFEHTGNSYAAMLVPHPYLGFVHRRGDGGLLINNVGLFGPDFPYKKDPDKFTILVTGGSVAAQLAQLKKDGIKYLQDILNSRYQFNGQQVLVLNGGDGAWAQPQQAILFLLYADVVDAVITLDGFNEHYQFTNRGRRLGFPADIFIDVNPIVHGYNTVAASWISNEIRKACSSTRFLKHSRVAWLFSHSITSALQRYAFHSYQLEGNQICRIFSLPDDWDHEACFLYNLDQYKKYIRMMNTIAKGMGIKSAFFIQPVPAIGKDLTEDEKITVGDLKYGPIYSRFTQALLGLKDEGIPIYDLLDVFENTNDTIYADAIHCIRYGINNESEGYRLMSEAIAAKLETAWGLKRKDG